MQTGKLCLCIAKLNEQLLDSKFHQVILNEDITISRQPGLLTGNSTVNQVNKVSSQVFLINDTNKLSRLREGSTIGKTEVKECNFVNVNDLNQQEQTSLNVLLTT